VAGWGGGRKSSSMQLTTFRSPSSRWLLESQKVGPQLLTFKNLWKNFKSFFRVCSDVESGSTMCFRVTPLGEP
jgi:hypothetical protein